MKPEDELDTLIRMERASGPPAGTAERTWQRLDASLAAGAMAATGSAAHAAHAAAPAGDVLRLSRAGWFLGKLWLVLAGAGMAAGIGGAVLRYRPLGSPSVNVMPMVAASPFGSASATVMPRVAPSPAGSTVRRSEESEISTEEVSPRAPLPARHSTSVAAPSRSADEGFERELQLIRRAKASLDASRFDEALKRLDDHARDFSHGVFATERDMLRFVVLCQRGTSDTLRAKANAFVEANPTSLSVDRVRRACGVPSRP